MTRIISPQHPLFLGESGCLQMARSVGEDGKKEEPRGGRTMPGEKLPG